jgi:hypothetical protein
MKSGVHNGVALSIHTPTFSSFLTPCQQRLFLHNVRAGGTLLPRNFTAQVGSIGFTLNTNQILLLFSLKSSGKNFHRLGTSLRLHGHCAL